MLTESLLAILLAMPVSSYDSDESLEGRQGRFSVVADAIVDAAHGNRGKVAFLAAQAYFESGLRRDVQMCECPAEQCDNGRAHSLWQLHRVPSSPESVWHGYCGTSYEAVRSAAERTLWAYDPTYLEVTFARLGGIATQPNAPWIAKRIAMVRRIERKL